MEISFILWCAVGLMLLFRIDHTAPEFSAERVETRLIDRPPRTDGDHEPTGIAEFNRRLCDLS